MITVKQVLEQYDISSNDSKNLAALVHAGLLEESKLPILNRALSKSAVMMTEAEKKSLQAIVESLASCVISEQQDYLSKMDTSRPMGYPSEKDIPTVLILKRKAIRVYPDNQKVALYYCQALNRYISVPYGKNAKNLGMVMNEETQLDEISQELATKVYTQRDKNIKDEDLTPEEKKKQRIKMATLSRMMGRNIQNADGKTVRTWAGPTAQKSAKFSTLSSPEDRQKMAMKLSGRERSQIPGATGSAIMGSLKHGGAEGIGAAAGVAIGDLTRKLVSKIKGPSVDPEAKTIKAGKIKRELQAGEVQGPVKSKFGNAPIKESFRKKLEEKRQEKHLDEEGAWDATKAFAGNLASSATFGLSDVAGRKLSKNWDAERERLDKEHPTAATVGDVAGYAVPGLGALKGAKLAAKGVKAGAEALSKTTVGKYARVLKRKVGGKLAGAANLAGAAADALGGSGGGSSEPLFKDTTKDYRPFGAITQGPTATVSQSKPTFNADELRNYQIQNRLLYKQNESNNLNIMKQIVENNISSHTIYLNETPITINNRVAKKVVAVYESLNRQNKKKVEKMLNEDALSFKKVINFAVRQ